MELSKTNLTSFSRRVEKLSAKAVSSHKHYHGPNICDIIGYFYPIMIAMVVLMEDGKERDSSDHDVCDRIEENAAGSSPSFFRPKS